MNRKILFTCAALAAAPLAWPVTPALAQDSVQDFRLKPGEPTAPSRAQGPVDADAPIRQPQPSPSPAPPPVIAVPAPTATPTVAVPTARPTAAAPANRPSPAATAAPSPVPEPAPTLTATAPAFPDLASPVPEIAPAAPVERVLPPAEEAPAIPIWAWLAAAAAALLAIGGWLFLRSRKPKAPVRLEPAPRPQPRPQPAPAPETPSAPAKLQSDGGLELHLTPRSLNSSLFMATLSYRIEMENGGTSALGPIAIAGDMIAAHASLTPQEQMAAAGPELAPMHRIEALQPGQKAEFTGEIRLPHSAITPIRKGSALFFVPLVRIYALNAEGSLIGGGTFVIGEPPATPGGRLRPFRLDLGPRNYPVLEQRKLAMPDAMPLDGRAMAG